MSFVRSKNKEIFANKQQIGDIVSKTINISAEIVGRTFGPGGSGVILDREDLMPQITKDGVTVLKSLGFNNAAQNTILDVLKEISLNTASAAGDGTSTAIILASYIYKYGLEFIKKNPKYNPQRFSRELYYCYNNIVVPYLKEISLSSKTEEDLKKVALISSNGDEEVANIVVEAIISSGEDGTVLIQENQGGELKIDSVNGYVITSGLKEFGSNGTLFFNDKASQQVVMNDGLVFLYDGFITELKTLEYIQFALEQNLQLYGKPIILMAHNFADNIVDKLAQQTRGGISLIPIKTPISGLPNSKQIFLHDMAAYTGATVMDGGSIASFSCKDFGKFINAKINSYESFIKCDLDSEKIESRLVELKSLMATAFSEHDKNHIKAHISKLTGGLVTILVGGITDTEIREKKDRIQDAIEAVRSAISEGVVLGGCATHIMIAYHINNHKEFKPSWEVLVSALHEPLKLLLSNCGEEDQYSVVLFKMHSDIDLYNKVVGIFNADSHEFQDGFRNGIIEPTKVHRIAIGNALSISSILATLGGIVCAPFDPQLEAQMEMSKMAFKTMMNQTEGE